MRCAALTDADADAMPARSVGTAFRTTTVSGAIAAIVKNIEALTREIHAHIVPEPPEPA